MQPVADAVGLSQSTTVAIAGFFSTMILLFTINAVVAAISDQKRAPSSSSGAIEMTQKKSVRDRFLVTGPAFAGKTQLYYKLIGCAGVTDTVSSSSLNETANDVEVKVPSRLVQQTSDQDESAFVRVGAKFVDVPGHFNFRKNVRLEASGAQAVILVLDAKEKTKYGEAAEILYDLLGDIDIISERIPILVACNKQDIPFAKNALQLEREL